MGAAVTAPADFDALARVVQRMDPAATLLRAWPLTGGVSAQVTALEVARADGHTERLVVRRHGATDLAHNPRIARDEHELLRIARAHGLAAPRSYGYDESGELLPTPYLVTEFVEGETAFEPADLNGYLAQAAAQLAAIHGVPDSPELDFLPRAATALDALRQQPDDSLNERHIRATLEAAGPPAPVNAPALLHGDYWPGNLLGRAGALAAVLDWEDARVGDPLTDLGNSRLEFLCFFGPDAMRAFTERYLAAAPIDTRPLPSWDLRAALRMCATLPTFGLDAAVERQLRERHAWFVAEALTRLGTG
jgi:aminoglycoside phosphotransferase (APT) family kinase protein